MQQRRPYTPPTVIREEFHVGVFGDYGSLDLGEFQPWEPPQGGLKWRPDR